MKLRDEEHPGPDEGAGCPVVTTSPTTEKVVAALSYPSELPANMSGPNTS